MINLVFKRGTAAQIAAHTGIAGTFTVDVDNNWLYVHDGVTPGGYLVDHADALQTMRTSLAGLTAAAIDGLVAALAAGVSADTVGQANGPVALDAGAKVSAGLLPSFVVDVVEVANFAALPATGQTSRWYISLADNRVYRWGGSAYFEITAAPTTTDVLTEGVTNRYFTEDRVVDTLSAAGDVTFDGGTGTFDLVVPPVTANTLGLGFLQNYGFATQVQAEALTSDVVYVSPLRLREIMLKVGLVFVEGEWVIDEGEIGFVEPMEALGAVSSDWQGEEETLLPIFFYGTTAENDALTLEKGQMSVDTDKDLLRIHDGVTQGGFEIPAA